MYLGVDIGTSATKAVLIDDAGAVVADASRPYEVSQPKPGWSEQDPGVWWRASRDTIRAVIESAGITGDAIHGLGLSGQMHGSCLLDGDTIARVVNEEAHALRPALLWNDHRTASQCVLIERYTGGVSGLVRRVGNAPLTGFTLPKLLWVREHEPEVWRRVASFCMPKDFVRFQLTGVLATDVGDAAGTLMLDVERRGWDVELAALVGIPPSILPRLVESGSAAGVVTPFAAEQTGLAPGTPVVAGSGDNQMGAIGAGVVTPGMVLATLGTSGVIYAHADEPMKDLAGESAGRVHTMCAADGTDGRPGRWAITGCMLSAAGSFAWARRVLAADVSFEDLAREAATSPPGARGLLFLPYLTGERCPHPDPEARGGWIGLTSRHTRADMIRAVMEGVVFGMGEILAIVRSLGVPVDRVRLSGGGNKSALWRQLQADVYGVPVARLEAEEGPAYGAALLAAVHGGVWDDVGDAAAAVCGERSVTEPGPDAVALARVAPLYADAYRSLRSLFPALGAIDAAHTPM